MINPKDNFVKNDERSKEKWEIYGKNWGVFVLLCCLMVLMPAQKVKAATYLGTLQFGTNYDFDGEGGYRKFDLVLTESGRVTFNFIAESSSDNTGIYLFDENETNLMTVGRLRGSYKWNLDLKAGTYTIIFNGGIDSNGSPWDRVPANGTMVASFTSADETFAENLLETNDEYGVASEIKKIDGKTVKGQFAVNDSVDYYTFDVKKSQKITVSYVTEASSSTMHIYKDSLDLEHWEEKLSSGSHKLTLTFPAGHYYLSLENVGDNTGNYTLKFSTSALPKVKLKSVKSTKAKTITVSYGKADVNSYQIQIATNSKFTGAKTYSSDTTSKVIKKLKSKKTYYVRVRTVSKAADFECYSEWSAAKKVEVK